MKLTDEEKAIISEENTKLIHYVIKKLNVTNVPYEELYSIGNLGFAKALDSFDKDRNIKFSTYCIQCIKNEIVYNIRKENRFQKNNISMNTVLKVNKNGSVLEFEEIISDEDTDKSLENNILKIECQDAIVRAFKHLKDEEKYIIIYRYGFDKGIIKTQKEIAKAVNMSQANVSKIEKTALKKLSLLLNDYEFFE